MLRTVPMMPLNKLLLIMRLHSRLTGSTGLVASCANRAFLSPVVVSVPSGYATTLRTPKRLKALEEKVARDGIELTEAQIAALERKASDDEVCSEIETAHPGYLGSQDTFYVGNQKGVGRIYQQTFVDTYSKVAHCKLYVTKTPIRSGFNGNNERREKAHYLAEDLRGNMEHQTQNDLARFLAKSG